MALGRGQSVPHPRGCVAQGRLRGVVARVDVAVRLPEERRGPRRRVRFWFAGAAVALAVVGRRLPGGEAQLGFLASRLIVCHFLCHFLRPRAVVTCSAGLCFECASGVQALAPGTLGRGGCLTPRLPQAPSGAGSAPS